MNQTRTFFNPQRKRILKKSNFKPDHALCDAAVRIYLEKGGKIKKLKVDDKRIPGRSQRYAVGKELYDFFTAREGI